MSNSIAEVLLQQSKQRGEKIAYTYLQGKKHREITMTYQELDQQARAIAAQLQNLQLTGSHVLLIYAPGLDFIAAFFGCLYAKVIAVPVPPPDPTRLNKTLPRLQKVVEDSGAKAILTTGAIKLLVQFAFRKNSTLKKSQWLVTNKVKSQLASSWQMPAWDKNELAYLQYTSGSTENPKGVMVSHGNVLENLQGIYHIAHTDENQTGVAWIPHFHDMGLIVSILYPMYIGFHAVLMFPLEFLSNPTSWLQLLSKYKAEYTIFPNFALELCIKKATPEIVQKLDLSNWKMACNSAETVYWESLEKFSEIFAPCGFEHSAHKPSYGMAETTLVVSSICHDEIAHKIYVKQSFLQRGVVSICEENDRDAKAIVSCGKVIPHHNIIIVDPQTKKICTANEVGEIWVSGPSVALGYWNKQQETADTFHAYTAEGDGPYLRSGDLGFLHNGHLFFSSRLKDLIVIRGRNFYPQDIEKAAQDSHNLLRAGRGIAFNIEHADSYQLIVVYEVRKAYKKQLKEQVINAIRDAIATEFSLNVNTVVLVKEGTIPLTSSGKVQRNLCSELFLQDELQCVATWQSEHRETLEFRDDLPLVKDLSSDFSLDRELLTTQDGLPAVEDYIFHEIRSALHLAQDFHIDCKQPLLSLGFDSMTSMEMKARIERNLEIEIPWSVLLQSSLGEIIQQIHHQLISSATTPNSQQQSFASATLKKLQNAADIEKISHLIDDIFQQASHSRNIRDVIKNVYKDLIANKMVYSAVTEVQQEISSWGQFFHYDIHVCEVPVKMAWVAGLFVTPSYRHSEVAINHIEQLFNFAIDWMRNEDFVLVGGITTSNALAGNLGGTSLTPNTSLFIDSNKITTTPTMEFNEFDGDFSQIERLYTQINDKRSGTVVRKKWWPFLMQGQTNQQQIFFASSGYMSICIKQNILRVTEVIGESYHFYEEAFKKAAQLAEEKNVKTIEFLIPPDHPLVHIASSYQAEFRSFYPGECKVAIINPPLLFSNISPVLQQRLQESTSFRDTRVLLNITTSFGEQNVGQLQHFRIEQQLNKNASKYREVNLDLSNAILSRMIFGCQPVRELFAHNQIDVDDTITELLDTLFPKSSPFIWEWNRL